MNQTYLLLDAGPEISVASTKAYTAQIALEAILASIGGTSWRSTSTGLRS